MTQWLWRTTALVLVPRPLFSLLVVSYFYCPPLLPCCPPPLVAWTRSEQRLNPFSSFSFQGNSSKDFGWKHRLDHVVCTPQKVHQGLPWMYKGRYKVFLFCALCIVVRVRQHRIGSASYFTEEDVTVARLSDTKTSKGRCWVNSLFWACTLSTRLALSFSAFLYFCCPLELWASLKTKWICCG